MSGRLRFLRRPSGAIGVAILLFVILGVLAILFVVSMVLILRK